MVCGQWLLGGRRGTLIGDARGRADISWEVVWLRLPDDGTNALPLLRHVVFNDRKSATYKLALLRVLVRIAGSASGLSRESKDGHLETPDFPPRRLTPRGAPGTLFEH